MRRCGKLASTCRKADGWRLCGYRRFLVRLLKGVWIAAADATLRRMGVELGKLGTTGASGVAALYGLTSPLLTYVLRARCLLPRKLPAPPPTANYIVFVIVLVIFIVMPCHAMPCHHAI